MGDGLGWGVNKPYPWGGEYGDSYFARTRPLGSLRRTPLEDVTDLLKEAGAREMTRDMIRGLQNALDGRLVTHGLDRHFDRMWPRSVRKERNIATKIKQFGGISCPEKGSKTDIRKIQQYIEDHQSEDLWYMINYAYVLIIFVGTPNELLDRFDAAAKVPIRRTGW